MTATETEKDRILREVSFWIATIAGLIALASVFSETFRAQIAKPATWVVASVAVILFLRMFARPYRQGIDRMNREMQGDDPWPGRGKKLSDPTWGLFGSRAGDRRLLIVRNVLLAGIIPVALAQHWVGVETVYLWMAAVFVIMSLSIMYGALHTPPNAG